MRKYRDISVIVIKCCITNHPKLCGIRNVLLRWLILWVRKIQRAWGEVEGVLSLEDPKTGVAWRLEVGIIWSSAHTFAGGWFWLLASALAGKLQENLLVAFPLWSLISLQHDIGVACTNIPRAILPLMAQLWKLWNITCSIVTSTHPWRQGHTDLSSCWEECQCHSRRACERGALITAILKDTIHSAIQQIVPNPSRNTKFSLGFCEQLQREGIKNSKYNLYLFSSFQF